MEPKLQHSSIINHLLETVVGTLTTLCLLAPLGMGMLSNGSFPGVANHPYPWARREFGGDLFIEDHLLFVVQVMYDAIW